MKKLIKIVLGIVLALVVVVTGAAIYVGFFIDPNDYKVQLQQLAREQGQVDLSIEGDLSWSLYPTLGLTLPKLQARTLAGEPMASLAGARVDVQVLPLLKGEVRMGGILLDGLQLDLPLPEPQKKAPAKPAGAAASRTPPAGAAPEVAATEQVGDAKAPSKPLLLDIGFIELRNAAISYRDGARLMTVKDLNLRADKVKTQQFFPLNLGFRLAMSEGQNAPDLTLAGTLDSRIFLDIAAQQYRLQGLSSRLQLGGSTFSGKQVSLQLDSDLDLNLATDRLNLQGLRLALANLALNADLDVQQLRGKPMIAGSLQAPAFSLQDLLKALGMPAVVTRDARVLQTLSLSSTLKGPANTLGLEALVVQLDDTRFTGTLRYDLATGAPWVRLQGDSLDIDRYLPPEAEASAAQDKRASVSPEYPKAPLLPLEVLRGLQLDAELGMAKLNVSGISIEALVLKAIAAGGKIDLTTLAGQLYGGSFDNRVQIDARREPVRFTINKQVQSIKVGDLLQDLAQTDLFSGALSMKGNYTARGNSVHALVNSLDGDLGLTLKDGRLKGINLSDQLCRGLLKLKGQPVKTEGVADYTQFSNLTLAGQFVSGVLHNKALNASLAGVSLSGNGQLDLPQRRLDYALGLTVLQELKGPNCQVDEKLHNISLPVRCVGGFGDPPAGLCRPDTDKMKQAIRDLGTGEVKAKAKAKLEQLEEKLEEKVGSQVQEKLKSSKSLDKLKGLFGQ